MTDSRYIFIRNNQTGRPGLKHAAVVAFKQGMKNKTFFEDLADIRRELLRVALLFRQQIEATRETLSLPILAEFPTLDPDFLRDTVGRLEEEAKMCELLWQRRRAQRLAELPKSVAAMYTEHQKHWMPTFTPGNRELLEHWLPFSGWDQNKYRQHDFMLKPLSELPSWGLEVNSEDSDDDDEEIYIEPVAGEGGVD